MEVSCQLKFNHFHFTHPLRHQCLKEARFLSVSALRPSGAYDGVRIGCFSFKQSPWRDLRNCGLSEKSISNRACVYASLGSFHQKEKFSGRYHDHNWHKEDILSRYIVVKSKLAGTGSAGAAYPLTEPQLGSKIRGICFYATTAVAAIFLFVLMLVAHPFVLLFDRYRRKAHHIVAKIWALLTVSPFFKIEFEGLENLPPADIPAVYVSNHQSFLDIYALLTLGRSFKFISKTAIFLFPIIGWAMFLLGVIPLKRMDSRSQLDCLKRCMELVRSGASVFFFPEGTRSKDGKIGPFKKGAFSVAAKTKVPVVPITLIGTGEIMPAGMEGRLNPGSVKVVIHRPIEGNNPDVLCSEARNVISDALHQG